MVDPGDRTTSQANRIDQHRRRSGAQWSGVKAKARPTGQDAPKRIGIAASLTTIGFGLAWVIATTSFPTAIAARDPDLALKLNPGHPNALMKRAVTARRILATGSSPNATPTKHSDGAETGQEPVALSMAEQAALKRQLTADLKAILWSEPLNARALRMLAELADADEQRNRLMDVAARQSRRDRVTETWHLRQAVANQETERAIRHATHLMSAHRDLHPLTIGELAKLATLEVGRRALANALSNQPRWRSALFQHLPKVTADKTTPLRLFLQMKNHHAPPTDLELAPYLHHLIETGSAGLAYYAWLQLAPQTVLAKSGLLANSGFEQDPRTIPFDWSIGSGRGASAWLSPRVDRAGERALRIVLENTRIQFPGVSQIVVLPSGRYVFSGIMSGKLSGPRGLRWRIHCRSSGEAILGQTLPLFGQGRVGWSPFEFAFTVPQQGCPAQRITLIHDARSQSEKYGNGEILFDDLKLARAASKN